MGNDKEGIVRGILDFSFSELIGEKVIPILYGVVLFFTTIIAVIVFFLNLFKGGWGVISAFLVVIGYVIAVVLIRIKFEIILLLFKMARDIRSLAQKSEQ